MLLSCFFNNRLLMNGLILPVLFGLVGCGGAADETPLVGDPPSSKEAKSSTVSSVLISRSVSSSYSSRSSSVATSVGVSSLTNLSSSLGSSSSKSSSGLASSSSAPQPTSSSSSVLPLSYLMGGAIQGQPLNLTGVVSTIAGAGEGSDGPALVADFNEPRAVAINGGNLYVADTDNQTIRKIVISTGTVTTIAGAVGTPGSLDGNGTAARFRYPGAIATDNNNLYVADVDNHTIRKIELASGGVTTLAGLAGESGFIDGVGSFARFESPRGVVVVGANLYVSSGNSIRQVVLATGEVTTFAGAQQSGANDGIGGAAKFSGPTGLATDGSNLYVADSGNHVIRKIVLATGAVSTLTITADIESGRTDENGVAYIQNPIGVAVDGAYLYMTEPDRNVIRKISIASGYSTIFAGSYGDYGFTDDVGVNATFGELGGIVSDGVNIYVTDRAIDKVRKIVIQTAEVSTFAGRDEQKGLDGAGMNARFVAPTSITTDGKNLYVSDWNENSIRKIDIAAHLVTTFFTANIIPGQSQTEAEFYSPVGITTDGTTFFVAGNVTGFIYKVARDTGVVSTWFGARDLFTDLSGVTTDGKNLYIVDRADNTIKMASISTGAISTLAGISSVRGGADGAGITATFRLPMGITTDGTNLYVADSGNSTIRKIVISTGVVSTLAGTVRVKGSVDGVGLKALFNEPRGITTDGTNLYVTDGVNNTIRKIVIATGSVTTLAGKVGGTDRLDGVGAMASFEYVDDITTDGYSLYVIDSGTVRKIH